MHQVRGSIALPTTLCLCLCLALTLTLGACGDRTPSEPASDATSAKDSTPSPGPCPATLPANAAACSPDGLVCQYGSDPRRHCRPQAACTSDTW